MRGSKRRHQESPRKGPGQNTENQTFAALRSADSAYSPLSRGLRQKFACAGMVRSFQLEGGHTNPKPVSTAVGTTGVCGPAGGQPTWALPKPMTVHAPD